MHAATQDSAGDLVPFEKLNLSDALVADLRSDHAGETGAVYIYRGVLRVSRDPEVIAFAQEHLATELQHLGFFDTWLPARHHSALLPLWRLSGWLLGALPALFGPRAVFATIAAVETFVEEHYEAQIDELAGTPRCGELRATLMAFCADEVAHRVDAAVRVDAPDGLIGRLWANVVDLGSRVGVFLARRL